MTTETSLPMTGGCQCGQARYEIAGAPLRVYVCHCRECQKQSGSAFGISVIVDSADLRLVEGTLGCWTRPTDSGGTLDCHFCADCGTRVWHRNGATSPTVSVKGGSLDTPPDIGAVPHIWTSRKLAGVVIPEGVPQSPREPG